jgi:hypothetical protein
MLMNNATGILGPPQRRTTKIREKCRVKTQKRTPTFSTSALLSLITISEKSGAGEGIRTLDPNLGKVVLYP